MQNIRVVPLTPDQLDPEQQSLYEAISGGRRASGPQLFRLRHHDGSLTGPFDLMLRHPALGRRISELGEALRYEGLLTDRAREIGILTVAVAGQSAFELYAHRPIARAVGLSQDEIDAVEAGAPSPFADVEETAIYDGARALLAHRDLGDEEYEALRDVLSPAHIVELTTLVGYYDLLASLMRVFAVGPPE